jgi:hypothetical protein
MKSSRSYSWETIAIAASFAAMWIYFLVWLWAGRNEIELSPAWQFLLLPALVLLIVIFARRLRRVLALLRGKSDGTTLPSVNGHPKK